mmetsp:Transcript_17588/g.40205  ORF Transcript_17588/g.40205 Transcript_17588/m.40205 type:complete len:1220 (-) Transcript_17588:60-3719(-)
MISNDSVVGGENGEHAIGAGAVEEVHAVCSSPCESGSGAEEGNNATPSTKNSRTDDEVDDQKERRISNLVLSLSTGSLSRISGMSAGQSTDDYTPSSIKSRNASWNGPLDDADNHFAPRGRMREPSRHRANASMLGLSTAPRPSSLLHSQNDDKMRPASNIRSGMSGMRVGAIHSTEKDSAEIQNKLGGGRHDDAATESRRSSRASQTSFDERLRRKLEESRPDSESCRGNDRKQSDSAKLLGSEKRSSRVSFCSLPSHESEDNSVREAGHGLGSAKGDTLPSSMTKETTNPKYAVTSFESDINVDADTNRLERRSTSDNASKNPVPKRKSSLSNGDRRPTTLSEEDYREFLNRKLSSRNVGMTYSERKRSGAVNSVNNLPRATANTLEGLPGADLDPQRNSRLDSVDSSYVRSSERRMNGRSLSSFYKLNSIRGVRSDTAGIPDEEEKEWESLKLENNVIIDAQVRASDEDMSRMSSEQTDPATDSHIFLSRKNLEHRRTHCMGSEARHYFTPEELAKIDLEQQQEDSIEVGDVSPEVIVNDAPSTRTRRLSWTNQLSRSMSALTNNSWEGRHPTDPFGAPELNLQMNEPSQQQLRNLADLVEAQDVVQARLVTDDDERDNVETVEAIPVNEKDLTRMEKFRRQMFLVWVPLMVIAGVILASIFATSNRGDEVNGTEPLQSIEKNYDPTLIQVRKEGVLRCGVPNKYGFAAKRLSNEMEGLSVDLCKAVAAAVLGSAYTIDLVEVTSITRFTALANREIDLLLWGDTHTMERDFCEKSTGVGFQFSDPYIYDGLGFAGFPAAVACADNFDWIGSCSNLKICVNAGTTHSDVLRDIFPAKYLVLCDTKDVFLETFVDGGCSVIAGEQNDVAEIVVRNYGYANEFGYGTQVLSKEPLAMVTRKDSQSWSDVANWVLRALIQAEVLGVTRDTADNEFPYVEYSTSIGIDFTSALRAVGNYGEIYDRHMEAIVPRKALNVLYSNTGNESSGLHYSHPVGGIGKFRKNLQQDSKISRIFNRGDIICGILSSASQESIEGDFCRALSASLFSSDTTRIKFVALDEAEMQGALDSEIVDVISGADFTIQSDMVTSETASGLSGLAFSQPMYYFTDSEDVSRPGMRPPKAMATSQSFPDWSTYVYWSVANLISSEELGITSSDFREVNTVQLLGEDFEWMFRGAILGVGNYREIYERNAEKLPPRVKENLLNDGSSPQLNCPASWS